MRPFAVWLPGDQPGTARLVLAQSGKEFMVTKGANDPDDFPNVLWFSFEDMAEARVAAAYFSHDEAWSRDFQGPGPAAPS